MDSLATKTRRQPLNVLGRLALIAAAALLMGLIIPGTIAWHSKVFFQKDIESLISKNFPDTEKSMTLFNKMQTALHDKLAYIDMTLIDASLIGSKYDFSSLRAEKVAYQSEIKKARAPISIQPFYQHIIMYFWPMMYLCLGTLVFLLSPPCERSSPNVSKRARDIIITTVVIFAFSAGHLFFRNIAIIGYSAGRSVYAYSNLDVDPASFIVQMANFLIFSFLLATLWHQWSNYFTERVKEIESNCFKSGLQAAFDVQNLDRVSKELLRWQICLGVLSTGFIIYTAIFWKQIIKNGDLRFLIEAFFAHALWFNICGGHGDAILGNLACLAA